MSCHKYDTIRISRITGEIQRFTERIANYLKYPQRKAEGYHKNRIRVMGVEEQKIKDSKWRLEEIFSFFEQSGRAHSNPRASRTVELANEAISLIKEFPSKGSKVTESAKERCIVSLKKAKEKAEEYMEEWNYKTNTPPSDTPSYFLAHGFSGLEYFLQVVRGNYF